MPGLPSRDGVIARGVRARPVGASLGDAQGQPRTNPKLHRPPWVVPTPAGPAVPPPPQLLQHMGRAGRHRNACPNLQWGQRGATAASLGSPPHHTMPPTLCFPSSKEQRWHHAAPRDGALLAAAAGKVSSVSNATSRTVRSSPGLL